MYRLGPFNLPLSSTHPVFMCAGHQNLRKVVVWTMWCDVAMVDGLQ